MKKSASKYPKNRITAITDTEIVKMFQRYLSTNDATEIDQFRSDDLSACEARLGLKCVNPQFREVIRNKARELAAKEVRQHESKIRAWNLVTGLLLGLAIAGLSSWL